MVDGIVFVKKAGMIQMLLYPRLQIFKAPEIDDKAIGVWLSATEGKRDRPVMSVNVGTVACVEVLPMGERNVAVSLFAGEHVK